MACIRRHGEEVEWDLLRWGQLEGGGLKPPAL